MRLAPLTLRSGYAWAIDPCQDSITYLQLSEGLRHGHGFARLDGNKLLGPETFRLPGYPFFLSLMPTERTAIAVQAMVAGTMCLLIGLFVSARWGPVAGVAASALFAADIPSIVYSDEIMSDLVFGATVLFAMLVEFVAIRRKPPDYVAVGLMLLASALLGYSALVRPIGLFVAPLAIVAALTTRANWRARIAMALLVISIPALVVSLWIHRNKSLAGVSSFSTESGAQLLYYRAAGTLAYANGDGWLAESAKMGTPPPQEYAARGARIILSHPVAFAVMTLSSLSYLCVVPDRGPLEHLLGLGGAQSIQDPGSLRMRAAAHQLLKSPASAAVAIFEHEFRSSLIMLILVLIQIVVIAALWVGALLAVGNCRRRSFGTRVFVLLSLAVVFVILVPASGPEAISRYRVPAVPFLAMLAALGWFRRSVCEA
ncbi:MAG: hypothetical protein WA005_18590 [Candidatus Binataceae bacterium]